MFGWFVQSKASMRRQLNVYGEIFARQTDTITLLEDSLEDLTYKLTSTKDELERVRKRLGEAVNMLMKNSVKTDRVLYNCAPFWGAIEMRDGVPFKWMPNFVLNMTAREQYEENIENGYTMPPWTDS